MKIFSLIFIFVACGLVSKAATEQVHLDISWSLDKETDAYTNNQTKISFPKSLAGFQRRRATPMEKDGGASFAYVKDDVIITLYLSHRLLNGLPGTDDCSSRFHDAYCGVLIKINGKADSRDPFILTYHSGEIHGYGTTFHFASSPKFGEPVYSEFGVVLVGDFLYFYRATSPAKDGLSDLNSFLRELGFEKKANPPPEAKSQP